MGQRAERRPWRRIGRRRTYGAEPAPPPLYSWAWIFAYVYYGILWILFVTAPVVIGLRERGIDVLSYGPDHVAGRVFAESHRRFSAGDKVRPVNLKWSYYGEYTVRPAS